MTLSDRLNGEVALIARREIRERTRGRLFRVVTALLLVAVAAAIVIPAKTKGRASHRTVGIVGTLSQADRDIVAAAGPSAATRVVIRDEPDALAGTRDLRSGRIDVAVIDSDHVMTKKTPSSTDTSTTTRLARTIAADLGLRHAIQAAGLTAAQVTTIRSAHALDITGVEAASPKGSGRSAATLGVILLFVLLSQYNTWTLTGVMEEKSSRVVEVLLATVRPLQLLAGKVLGIGTLVFAQAGLVVAFALVVADATGSDLLHGAGPATVISMLVWLVLGYAFYSWVYAAAGSLAERQDQIQSIAVPIAIPMVLGYITALTTAGSGHSTPFVQLLAYLPPTAPFTMPVLVGIGAATWWQVLVSALLSLAATVAVARAAAAVYRRAVLRTGRRVKLRDVVVEQRG